MQMYRCSRILAGLLVIAVSVAAQAQTSPEQATAEMADVVAEAAAAPVIDDEALEVFKAMSDHLAAAREFAFHTETSHDVVQRSGVKVEFGASRRTLVSRPNKMRLESRRRDGVSGVVIFDGKNMWAYVPDENVFASHEQQGDLDDAIDYAVAELGIEAPLADLVSPDLYESATSKLTSALYLGETEVAGETCEHLLMSNDIADFQLWITAGDKPLLRRIVITYRDEPGEPQYRAQFSEWDLAPEDTANQLRFEPPAGAERVRFYMPAPPTDLDQEDKS
jgi:hypothetical protein